MQSVRRKENAQTSAFILTSVRSLPLSYDE
jgi:hypothetical protein